MNWTKLENRDQLLSIDEESKDKMVLIFKHSTRCSISSTALDRLERNWKEEDANKIKPYYLDLLAYRAISDEISSRYKIEHESPQVLLIQNGVCIYHASHLDIDLKKIMSL